MKMIKNWTIKIFLADLIKWQQKGKIHFIGKFKIGNLK